MRNAKLSLAAGETPFSPIIDANTASDKFRQSITLFSTSGTELSLEIVTYQ